MNVREKGIKDACASSAKPLPAIPHGRPDATRLRFRLDNCSRFLPVAGTKKLSVAPAKACLFGKKSGYLAAPEPLAAAT